MNMLFVKTIETENSVKIHTMWKYAVTVDIAVKYRELNQIF